jgi:hypothetical protein
VTHDARVASSVDRLESGLAASLHAAPGDTVTIQGQRFLVRGAAQTVSRGRFPLSRPAQVWVTPETAGRLRSLGMTEEGFELQLRLADPNQAAAFVAAHRSLLDVSDPSSSVNGFLRRGSGGGRTRTPTSTSWPARCSLRGR